jgi:hypothetical protein
MIGRDIGLENMESISIKKTDKLHHRLLLFGSNHLQIGLSLPLFQMTKCPWQWPISFEDELQGS